MATIRLPTGEIVTLPAGAELPATIGERPAEGGGTERCIVATVAGQPGVLVQDWTPVTSPAPDAP